MGARAAAIAVVSAACSIDANYGGTSYQCRDGVCPAGFRCVAERCAPEGIDAAPPAVDAPVLPPDAPGVDAPAPDAAIVYDPPWWDPSFSQRRRLVVSNVATEPLPVGFQVRFLLDLHAMGLANNDHDTFRVVEWNGSTWTEHNRVIDDTDDNIEAIWIRLPHEIAAGNDYSGLWLYYDHPSTSLTAPSSSSALFEYYDGFNGTTLDTAAWDFLGTIVVAAGAVELGNGDHLGSIASYGPGVAVDYFLRIGLWTPRFWGGFQVATSLDDVQPWIIWISRADVADRIWPEFLADETGDPVAHVGPMTLLVAGEKHVFSIDRHRQKIVYRYEHLVVDEHVPAVPYETPLRIRLTNEGVEPIFFEMVRIRRTIDPYPETIVLGAESGP